ncbi:MAG TPA: pyridoxamine 5'-phosphate oxidase family protein [Puia sp.]|nr:pyridoxamine 5'-phosphate oxidase family protein [Puia sp.]
MNIELQELQTGVLKSKIMELQSALFFTESSSLVKLPTHVISETEVDAEGQIWFVIPKPAQHIEAFDKEIPAKLDYFKKGNDSFVKITGTAFLITDAAEIVNTSLSADMHSKMQNDQVIAVKVKVQVSELIDNTPKPTKSWFQASRSQLSSWFF